MEDKKNSYLARLLAALGLITAVVVMIVAIGAATSSDEEPTKGKQNPAALQNQEKPRTKKKQYKVQEGDSLTAISQKTGIPVEELEALNPELDPQALQPGQKLKLR